MNIGPNKWQLYGKMVMIPVLGFAFVLLGWALPHINYGYSNLILKKFLLLAIWIFLFFLYLLIILEMLIFPKELQLDEDGENITLKYLAMADKTFEVTSVCSYVTVIIRTRHDRYDGMIVTLASGEKYVISDFTLKNTQPVKTLLEQKNIPYLGQIKFRPVTYFLHYFGK